MNAGEQLLNSMLVTYAAKYDAMLQSIPNNTVIVMTDEVREKMVSRVLEGVRDGVKWILENKDYFESLGKGDD